jgi:hypothetical protein
MRLTRNEHHRKLRALIRDISDWLANADSQIFATPCRVPAMYPPPQKAKPFVPPRLPAASHDYLLPPTTTCCLPRLRRCDRAW